MYVGKISFVNDVNLMTFLSCLYDSKRQECTQSMTFPDHLAALEIPTEFVAISLQLQSKHVTHAYMLAMNVALLILSTSNIQSNVVMLLAGMIWKRFGITYSTKN